MAWFLYERAEVFEKQGKEKGALRVLKFWHGSRWVVLKLNVFGANLSTLNWLNKQEQKVFISQQRETPKEFVSLS